MLTELQSNTAELSYAVNLRTLGSSKPFDAVINDFEMQLGRLDQERATASPERLPEEIRRMQGENELMIVAVLEMDRLLPFFIAGKGRARQYLVGNPLIADLMAKHDARAALYAPPRVLIYTDGDQTMIAYDQPSTVFGKFASAEITETARRLDEKFEALTHTALL